MSDNKKDIVKEMLKKSANKNPDALKAMNNLVEIANEEENSNDIVNKPNTIPVVKPIGNNEEADAKFETEKKTRRVYRKKKKDEADNLNVLQVLTVDILKQNGYEGLKLRQIIDCYSREIEELLYNRGKINSLTLDDDIADKTDWDDRHPAKSYPADPLIHDAINIVWKRSGLKKYQVFERLILGGLLCDKFWK